MGWWVHRAWQRQRPKLEAMKRWTLAVWALLACCMAQAQPWPQRPIRLIVPYAFAGASDIQGRLLASMLTHHTGWKIEVVNRTGGAGSVGLDSVAKALPDGHTLAIGQTSNLVIHQALGWPRPYDAPKAFTPIALLGQQPLLLVVRADSPHVHLTDLLNAARNPARPLTLVSAGNGSVGHLAGALLMKRVGGTLIHIPYNGAAPALTALMSGHGDFALPTVQAAAPHIQSGRLRVLSITSARRWLTLPQTPTLSEAGVPGLVIQEWKMLVGPTGMSTQLVQRLHQQVHKVLTAPEWSNRLGIEAVNPHPLSLAELSPFLEAERQRWRNLAREIPAGSF